MKEKAILIAEDTDSYRESFQRLVSMMGGDTINVIAVTTGQEAIDVIESDQKIDAAVIDYEYDEVSGYEGANGEKVVEIANEKGINIIILNTGVRRHREELVRRIRDIGVEISDEPQKMGPDGMEELLRRLDIEI